MILITSVLTGVSYIMSGNVLFLGVASANIAYSFHGKKVMRSMLFSGLITTLFLLVGQFFLSNIIFNLTQLYFETPMITTLLVTPIFIAVILLKKQKV
jgi:ferrichrome ABC transporter